jgi:3-methyladenine DNA glycosylase AlkD
MADHSAGQAFVAAHREAARALGKRLAQLIDTPEEFVSALRSGLTELSDPDYAALVRLVSPGVPTPYAVRGPLTELVSGPLRGALRASSSSSALWLAARLADSPERDVRLYALPCLRRSSSEDPEQTWQLLRRMAGRAGDWIETDSLADVWARGILAEPFRWAELEQLVYSPRVFERRLVGATLATLPHRVTRSRRADLAGASSHRAFGLIRQLMGDAADMVQKALSWAIREWARVDPDGAADLLRAEVELAVSGADGARAWVVRDSLAGQPAQLAASHRSRLAGLRRDRHSPSTSPAAAQAARFAPSSSAHDAEAVQGHRYARSRA